MNQSCHIQIHHVLVSVHRSLLSVNRFLVCLDIFFLYLSPISLVISLFTITHRLLSSVLLPCLFCVWNDLVFVHGSLCVILGVLLLSCDLSLHCATSRPHPSVCADSYFLLQSAAVLMGWLRCVGSLKLQVSFAEYRLFYRALLQLRPLILRSLLILATP